MSGSMLAPQPLRVPGTQEAFNKYSLKEQMSVWILWNKCPMAQASAFTANNAGATVAAHLSTGLWGPVTTRKHAHCYKQAIRTANTRRRAGTRLCHCSQKAAWTSAELCPDAMRGRRGHCKAWRVAWVTSVSSTLVPTREYGKGGRTGLLAAPLHQHHYSFGALI